MIRFATGDAISLDNETDKIILQKKQRSSNRIKYGYFRNRMRVFYLPQAAISASASRASRTPTHCRRANFSFSTSQASSTVLAG
jgi:hypothetical protein